MREIKFRAWNAELKKMSKSFSLGHVVTLVDEKGSGSIMSCVTPGLKIMQFTGLYDKNDTEVYEGDILINPYKKIGIIFFKEGAFFLKVKTSHKDQYDLLSKGYLKNKKVIGNIYQNPDLL